MQPLGPDCEESCFIKPKTQMFHPTVATKLSTNAESLNLELAPLTYCHSFRLDGVGPVDNRPSIDELRKKM